MAAVNICSDFGAPKNKICHYFHCFPIYLPWSDGTRCHDLSFLNVKLKSVFHSPLSLSSRERLFSSSLSAIRVVPSAYLRLLISLPAILIPACASSSPEFLMFYSAYKLNTGWQYTALMYSVPDLEPVCFYMYSSNSSFLICIQISQEAGQVVWRIFFSLWWSTQSKALA